MEEVINGKDDIYKLLIKYPGGNLPDLIINHSAYSLFEDMITLKSIKSIRFSRPIFDCGRMFYNCNELIDVPLFNTYNVENMNSMFYSCYKLKKVPLFDTSNVKVMSWMFSCCRELETIPLLDTRNAKKINDMFWGCWALKEIPELNVDPFIEIGDIIKFCNNLKKIPNFILLNELAK